MLQRSLAALAVVLLLSTSASAVVLFSDDFNTAGSATNYSEVGFSEYLVTHAFDYSSLGIPPAPKTTDATTLGVKFEANMSTGSVAAVTLHTTQQFTGSYSVTFDAWINANGPMPGGGTGSTEFLTAGVGGDGITVNRLNGTGIGGWTAVDGEGGSTIDYRFLRTSTLEGVAGGTYAAGTQATARAATDPYYAQFGGVDIADLPVQGANQIGGFPQQSGVSLVGTFGYAWHEVELVVNATGGTGGAAALSWFVDGLRIGTLDAGAGAAFATNGSVTIGYSDPFASISDNALLSFGLIDNLSVSTLAPAVNPDFNGNTVVDAADYVLWRKNRGLMSGAMQSQGDANGDGKVDDADYGLWVAAFGNSVPGSGAVLATAVPEPASLALVALACAALVGLLRFGRNEVSPAVVRAGRVATTNRG